MPNENVPGLVFSLLTDLEPQLPVRMLKCACARSFVCPLAVWLPLVMVETTSLFTFTDPSMNILKQ